MDPRAQYEQLTTRRSFLRASGTGLGFAALATLLGDDAWGQPGAAAIGGLPGLPHVAPTAKRVIYLCMPGAPSHHELFDYKPGLAALAGQELPESVLQTLKLTGMTATQSNHRIVPSFVTFAQHGQSGAWVSDLLPHTAKAADHLCIIRSMWSDQINHDPALTKLFTGFQLSGRPTIGAWVNYALGSENQNLPGYVAMSTAGLGNTSTPFLTRYWGMGWLPTRYGGVQFGSGPDPVLYLSDPDGFTRADRRLFLDQLAAINQTKLEESGDPEIEARISQYEMAARMQLSIPELADLSKEPDSTFELYGEDARKGGTFARNCLLARRLAERGVRFVLLAHAGWDHHTNLPTQITKQCKDIDQGAAALVQDLKQRGMLDDTLVIWGGEFGRTVFGQVRAAAAGGDSADKGPSYGRDHFPNCYTIWMAGGGVKAGITYGETDDFSTSIVKDPVSPYDLQATILRCIGIDHTKLTYKYQGRNFRLTDVSGNVVKGILKA